MNKNNMTLKEYLLSQGINAKQKKLERKVSINNDKFIIKISELLEDELLDLEVKEVFILAYKSMLFLKSSDEFSIIYTPKEVVINGNCNKANDNYEIILNKSFKLDSNELNNKKNIFIIDSIDKNIKFEIL